MKTRYIVKYYDSGCYLRKAVFNNRAAAAELLLNTFGTLQEVSYICLSPRQKIKTTTPKIKDF